MPRVARLLLSLRVPLVAAAVALATANFAWADPPARVGRLSQISGTVSSHAGDEDQWSPAVLNEPVTSGNAFWTEPGSHAEIHVGSTALRMDGSTELDVTQLDDSFLQSQLMQGTVSIDVPRIHDGETYVVTTPRGTITLLRGGRYRIEAGTDADPTRVTVLRGQARVSSPGSDLVVGEGESARITGTETIAAAIEQAAPTALDSWDPPRASGSPAPLTARYVSPETTGYEDLDAAGRWREEPNYGPVWYPRAVPVDWAPYRYGHWRWVAPWGWTWIDDAPWGFAPFHYGRWAYIGDEWGWAPGPVIVERPVYAPALVIFIGGGRWRPDHWRDRDEAVGWFPLAPHEAYRPSYAASATYIRNVNVTNVTNVTSLTVDNVNATNGRYGNRAHATVVSQAAFAGAQPIARAAVAIPAGTLAQAPIVGTAAPVAPQRRDVHRAAVTAAPGPALPPAGRRGAGQAAGVATTAPAAPQAGARSLGAPARNASPIWGSSRPAATAQAQHPTGAPGPAIRPVWRAADSVAATQAPIAGSAIQAAAPARTALTPTPSQPRTGAPGPPIAATTGRLPAIPSRPAFPPLRQSSGNPMVAQTGHAQPAARPAPAPIPAPPRAMRQEAAPPRNAAPAIRAVAAPEPPRRTMPVQQAAAPRQPAPAAPPPVRNAVIRQPAPIAAAPQAAARPAPPAPRAAPLQQHAPDQPAKDQHRPPRPGEPGYVAPPR